MSRVAGLANFCAWVSSILFKTPYFSGFPGHSNKENAEKIQILLIKIEDFCWLLSLAGFRAFPNFGLGLWVLVPPKPPPRRTELNGKMIDQCIQCWIFFFIYTI